MQQTRGKNQITLPLDTCTHVRYRKWTQKIAVDTFHKSTRTQLSLNLGRVTPPPSVQHHLPIAVHWLHPFAHYAKLERFVTKVVQLCSSPSLQLQHFDLTDGRRVQFKHHLNAHPVYDISQDKS